MFARESDGVQTVTPTIAMHVYCVHPRRKLKLFYLVYLKHHQQCLIVNEYLNHSKSHQTRTCATHTRARATHTHVRTHTLRTYKHTHIHTHTYYKHPCLPEPQSTKIIFNTSIANTWQIPTDPDNAFRSLVLRK